MSEQEAAPPGGDVDLRLMARALAWLYAVNAALSLLTLLLPHSEQAEELGVLIVRASGEFAGTATVQRVVHRHGGLGGL